MILSGPTGLRANTITLKTQLTSTHQPDGIALDITIQNEGSEPAYNLQVEAALNDNQQATARRGPGLEPGETFDTCLDLGTAPALSGVHSAVAYIEYADADGTILSS